MHKLSTDLHASDDYNIPKLQGIHVAIYVSISIPISMQERNFCKFERAKQFGSYAQIR